MLLELFGENSCDMVCPEQCCDVCDQKMGLLGDKKLELTLLLQAIDELKNVGEVKITEWIRGGNVAWMQNVTKLSPSAYGKSPLGLSKEWWRSFIRQCSAAGYILHTVKPATFEAASCVQGAYAQLEPTPKGRDAVSSDHPTLLSEINEVGKPISKISDVPKIVTKRIGKGKHLLPTLKSLLCANENWLPLETKEMYQYPGMHKSLVGNALYYTENVESLPHFSDPHFLWSAIQLSKTSSTKSRLTMEIDSKVEGLNYWLSHCNGVKKCEECDHVLPKSYSKNNCKEHPEADLITTEIFPVEFIYVYPQNAEDKKKVDWRINSKF